MLARYYSSSLGRFMAADAAADTTLTNPQSWNRFAYVRNNPMRHSDPKGTMGQDDVGGTFAQALRNMPPLDRNKPLFTPEQWAKARESAEATSENLKAGSLGFGIAALYAIETPLAALGLGMTSGILGWASVGCDVVVWVTDPTSGDTILVLVSDGVAIVLGRWAANLLEEFLMAPIGVGAAADAMTGVAVDAGAASLQRQKKRSIAPDSTFGSGGPRLVPEPEPEVKTWVICEPEQFIATGQ